MVYILPRGADLQTTEGVILYSTDTELAPERIFRLYGARFQIEFAFRDAKQHLGLHHSQARAQAKLHFHFNIVFAALFWARLQARARAEHPLGPFSLRHLEQHNFEKEIYGRFAARSAAGRNSAKSEAGHHRILPERLWLCALPLEPERSRPAPERHPSISLAIHFRPQNCPNHKPWVRCGYVAGIDTRSCLAQNTVAT